MKKLNEYNTQDLSIVSLQARIQRDRRLLKRCLDELQCCYNASDGEACSGEFAKLIKDLDLRLQED